MGKQYVMGVDVGTTGVKAIVFDLKGQEMGSAYYEYGCVFPKSGWVEQDGEFLWQETCRAIREAIVKAGVDPHDIASLGLSTQRCTMAPVDKEGNVLYNSISWQDRRSTKECEEIGRTIGAERYYAITGLPIDTTWTVSKIMWLRANEPKVFEKTYKFALDQERVLFKLGADDFYEDASNGSLQGLMDIETFTWSDELIQSLNIPKEKLPKLVRSAQQVGVVSEEASKICGLAAGTPIVTGGGDQQCAGVGAGVIKPNSVEVTLGTAGVTMAYLESPARDKQRRIPCSAHAVPGKWESEGLQLAAGSSYKWYRNNIASAEVGAAAATKMDPYDIINLQIAKVPPGCGGVICLPFFAGAGAPHWDPYARGTFIGLNLSHGREVLARAIIEGVSFETREVLEALVDLGVNYKEVILTGGAAKSDLWNQIQADIYGKPCRKLLNEQATCSGAAILGAVGAGVHKSLEEAVDQMVHFGKVYEPDKATHAVYDKVFALYKTAYKSLKEAGVYKELVDMNA
jgi:xylulokinase